ncbi:MAG: ATP-binding protein [Thermotaleaceae bacterium]
MSKDKKNKPFRQLFHYLWLLLRFILKILPFIFLPLLRLLGQVFASSLGNFKKLFRFSITFKITVVYSLIFALLLFSSSTVILLGFRYFLRSQVGDTVDMTAAIVESYLYDREELPASQIEELAQRNHMGVAIFNDQRQLLYSNSSDEDRPPLQVSRPTPSLYDQGARQIILLHRELQKETEILHLQIWKDFQKEQGYLAILKIIFLVTNGMGIFITLLIGSRISRRMLSPIARMTDKVKAITIQDLDTRLDVGGAYDELKELAETFNGMIDRIQSSYEQQNQFVSDASHELRTPISVIQGYASLIDRWGKNDMEVLAESIHAIKGESENMKELTEKLLFLARNDKNLLKLEKEEFFLNDLIEEVVKETKLIDNKHQISASFDKEIFLWADRKLLKQALRVFTDNSVKYTPEMGEIKLSSFIRKNQIVIEIKDTGIGIPQEDIPYIFHRFYRADKSRTKESGGHGLGLSIAKLIIDKHNGRIVVDSKLQGGTTIRILLPPSHSK